MAGIDNLLLSGLQYIVDRRTVYFEEYDSVAKVFPHEESLSAEQASPELLLKINFRIDLTHTAQICAFLNIERF